MLAYSLAYFARIIPDTRPSGSLRSRLVYSWRSRRFFHASPNKKYPALIVAAKETKPPTPSSSPAGMIAATPHCMRRASAAALRVSSLIRALRVRFAHEKSLPAIFSPPSNLWLVCEESVARVRANVGGMPPTPPASQGETPVSTRRRASLHDL